MTSIKFIEDYISKLVVRFPEVKCLYEYGESDDSHIVKVEPIEVFKNNEEYAIFENEMYLIFSQKYPQDSLLFITNDSLVDVKNPIYEKTGRTYLLNILKNYTLINNQLIDFPEYKGHFEMEFNNWIVNEFIDDGTNAITTSVTATMDCFNEESTQSPIGNNNYALAA